MTIGLANTLDKNCSLRTLEMAFQSIKIQIAARSFGTRMIPQWLKIIPVLHTQKVLQSAISTNYVHLTHE